MSDLSKEIMEITDPCIYSNESYGLNVTDTMIPGSSWCPKESDGILCWPSTQPGHFKELPCFEMLHGIPYNSSGTALRECTENGTWDKTDYTGCHHMLEGVRIEEESLSSTHVVYLIGYSVSFFAVVLAAFIFHLVKELHCLRNKIHFNLVLTYTLSDALWVMGFLQSKDENRYISCINFIFLHYFHLTNFFWMFVEGLYLYLVVVKAFIIETVQFRFYVLVGWGMPLAVVVIWWLSKWSYQRETQLDTELLDIEFAKRCPWFRADGWDWIYKSSALSVLIANAAFLIQIMWVLVTKLRSSTTAEVQQMKKTAKALLVLIPLLGITYVLVLMDIGGSFYTLLRAFLLSTQGFLVALLYCFLNSEVRVALRHRWNRFRLTPFWARRNLSSRDRSFRTHSKNSRASMRDPEEPPFHNSRVHTPRVARFYRKRESSSSETTTTAMIVTAGQNRRISVPSNCQTSV